MSSEELGEDLYLLIKMSFGHADYDDGFSKLELLRMLASDLGYGVYALHKTEGKKKELTVTCYSDGSAVIDIHKHRVAYKSPKCEYEITTNSKNNSMQVWTVFDNVENIETEV